MKLINTSTLAEVAALINSPFVGEKNHPILGFNEIHWVGEGDVTFVDVEKYYDKALSSAATTIIINKEVPAPKGKALIIHPEPFTAYNFLTEYFHPRKSLDTAGTPKMGKDVKIGRNVVFGENVSLADGVEIGHNSVLGSNISIGEKTLIHANVTIYDDCLIGSNVCINSGTVIGGEAFYFKSRKESKEKLLTKGRVIIDNHVDIGANCTIDRGVSGDTIIGEYTKLDNLIQIGHDTVIGKRCLIAAQVGIAGVVKIEDEVIIWGQAGVNKDLVVGKGAVILGKTGIMSSIEGGKKYLGFMGQDARHALKSEIAMRDLPNFMHKVAKLFEELGKKL